MVGRRRCVEHVGYTSSQGKKKVNAEYICVQEELGPISITCWIMQYLHLSTPLICNPYLLATHSGFNEEHIQEVLLALNHVTKSQKQLDLLCNVEDVFSNKEMQVSGSTIFKYFFYCPQFTHKKLTSLSTIENIHTVIKQKCRSIKQKMGATLYKYFFSYVNLLFENCCASLLL